MNKNFRKVCIRTILTYFVIIFMICLLKVFNVNCFGIKYDNTLLNKFNEFVMQYNLKNVWYSLTLYIYTYFILSISCNDNSKRMKLYSLIITVIAIPYKFLMNVVPNKLIRTLLEVLFMLVPPIIYKKKIKKTTLNTFTFIILNIMFQAMTLYCKNLKVWTNQDSFITNIMFDIDYIIMQLLFYHYYFGRKEVSDLWRMVVGLLSGLWHGFMQLPDLSLALLKHLTYGLKKQLDTIKKAWKSKTERIDSIAFLSIYYLLTLFWNVATIILIVLIAQINDMAITIVFVLFAFIFNKGKFGKPLHLKSAFWCFIISNTSYYFISRLTLPIGTSYLVPILIGVCMSYYTALIVKRTTLEIYKGMPEEELREICKVRNLDKYKTEFLIDFYCNKMNYVQLHFKYKYSIDRLRHMKMEYLQELKNS